MSASALMETGSEFGGALGIAVLGSIGAAVYGGRLAAHLPPGCPRPTRTRPARTGRRGGDERAPARSLAERCSTAARHAFTDGMNVVAWVGAAILVAAAATTVLLRPSELRCSRRGEAGVDQVSSRSVSSAPR